MRTLDWIVLIVPILIVIWSALKAQKHVRGVADFLSAGRIAGRYVLCIASGEAVPVAHLRASLQRLAAEPSHEAEADCEYHIKMYGAIVKSALREAVNCIVACDDLQMLDALCVSFVTDVRRTLCAYREAGAAVEDVLPESVRHYCAFGDEYMSYCVSGGGFRILERLERVRRQDVVRAARTAALPPWASW